MIYPPATFFFFTLTFIKFIFGPKIPSRAKLADIAAEVMILIFACITYFLTLKLIWKPLLLTFSNGQMDFQAYYSEQEADQAMHVYRFLLSSDLPNFIERINDLCIFVFSAWFPPLQWYLIAPVLVLFIIVLTWGAVVSPYLCHLRTSVKIGISVTLSILVVFFAALPVLAPSGYTIQYRAVFASMTLVPVVIVFMLDRVTRRPIKKYVAFPILVVVTALILAAGFSSYYRIALQAKRLSAEYQHVVAAVSHTEIENSKLIRIPPFSSPPDPWLFLYRDWGYAAVSHYTDGIARAASRDIGRSIDGFRIEFDPLGPRYKASLSDGIEFSHDGYPFFISKVIGIDGKESFGRWTDGEEAILEFEQPLPKTFTLKIKAGTSSGWTGKPITVIAGTSLLKTVFSKSEPTEIQLHFKTDGNTKSIILKFPGIKTLSSTDTRRLGLALISLRID